MIHLYVQNHSQLISQNDIFILTINHPSLIMNNMKEISKIKTTFLKVALVPVIAFILFFFVVLTQGLISSYSDYDIYFVKILFYLALYIAAALSLVVTIFVYRILLLIERGTAFTEPALKIISTIKKLSFATFFVLLGILPMTYHIIEVIHAPVIMVIGVAISVTPLIVAIFIATIEKLLQSVIQIKSENDLTV